jgi:hypothetical protein
MILIVKSKMYTLGMLIENDNSRRMKTLLWSFPIANLVGFA